MSTPDSPSGLVKSVADLQLTAAKFNHVAGKDDKIVDSHEAGHGRTAENSSSCGAADHKAVLWIQIH